MVFTKADLVLKVENEDVPEGVIKVKPAHVLRYRQKIEKFYFEEYEIEDLDQASFQKLDNDFFTPFLARVLLFYNEKKSNYMVTRMIKNHEKWFNLAVPSIDQFLVPPEPPEPPEQEMMDIFEPPEVPLPNGDQQATKKPLKSSQMYEVVNMVAELYLLKYRRS